MPLPAALLSFQVLGPFKDMALAFPEEEWRHVTPAQIDCFGEYVEPQECGVTSPGKGFPTLPSVRWWRAAGLSIMWAWVTGALAGTRVAIIRLPQP